MEGGEKREGEGRVLLFGFLKKKEGKTKMAKKRRKDELRSGKGRKRGLILDL